jgi:hypothetical protein
VCKLVVVIRFESRKRFFKKADVVENCEDDIFIVNYRSSQPTQLALTHYIWLRNVQ